jgi:hypothetical protein
MPFLTQIVIFAVNGARGLAVRCSKKKILQIVTIRIHFNVEGFLSPKPNYAA